jgi:hypothetical protein
VTATDSLRVEAPAAQAELTWLLAVKVGDTRSGVLFPAFETPVEWVCTEVGIAHWEFTAQFCGLPLCGVRIEPREGMLVLTMKESV